jgi:Cu/Ag efflux pump CusA
MAGLLPYALHHRLLTFVLGLGLAVCLRLYAFRRIPANLLSLGAIDFGIIVDGTW